MRTSGADEAEDVTSIIASDREPLARAVALAQRAVATTSPNPAVGCVLVRDHGIVGEGTTAPVGGPHAEVVALRAAGERARGATAYVTLEPCAHHGRTPPCTDALLAAGVARVVFLHPDPDPVAAGGAQRLRAAGVTVDGPPAADDPYRAAVAAQLEGFCRVVERGRPALTLKLAQTLDGRLRARPPARWVTGPAARAAVHRWRATVDAVLVGSGTVLADDPALDVRAVAAVHQPRPVVLDARLRTPPTARVVARGALLVTTPHDGDGPSRAALEAAGATLVDVPAGTTGGVDLEAALAALVGYGVTSVLAEPGHTLATALVAAGLVDRLVLHVAAGGAHFRPAVGPPPGGRWWPERVGGAGPDAVVHLVPRPAADTGHDEEAA